MKRPSAGRSLTAAGLKSLVSPKGSGCLGPRCEHVLEVAADTRPRPEQPADVDPEDHGDRLEDRSVSLFTASACPRSDRLRSLGR